MQRPIGARIDLAALRHNYLLAREYARRRDREARAWAVVKANAYGHGLLRAAAALGDVADGFALLDLDEAIALRQAGIRQPILLLEGFFEVADLAPAHAAAVGGYGLDRFRDDHDALSDVVEFDRPRLGDVAGLRALQTRDALRMWVMLPKGFDGASRNSGLRTRDVGGGGAAECVIPDQELCVE